MTIKNAGTAWGNRNGSIRAVQDEYGYRFFEVGREGVDTPIHINANDILRAMIDFNKTLGGQWDLKNSKST